MTEMTLEQLQERVWSMVESCDMGTSIDARTVNLDNEVCELFDALLQYERADEADKPARFESLTKEIADVIITILALAKSLEITNPTEITLAKIDDTEERYQQTENNN